MVLKWIWVYPFGRDLDFADFWTNTKFITISLYFILSNYKGKKGHTLQYFTDGIIYTGITKSTRKSVKLLTILVAFSSDFVKRGTCLLILYKNMRDI